MTNQEHDVQPAFSGTIGNLVFYGGRIMARVAGAETPPPPAPGQGADPAQGTPAGGDPLYDLSGAPDELRPFLEQELKKVEANVTRRFEDAANFRKQWEPFQSVEGLTEFDPEELSRLVSFHREVLSNPEAFENWFRAVGEEYELFPNAADTARPEDVGGETAGDEEGLDPVLDAAIARVMETLDQRLAPFEQQLTEQQQEQRVSEAQEEIRTELDGLKEKHGEFNEDLVCQLSLAYEGAPDAIQRGFADYQRFIGESESGVLDSKGDAPGQAETGGAGPATQVEPITDFGAAKEAAKRRFAGARS